MWLYHRLEKIGGIKKPLEDYMEDRSKRILSSVTTYLKKEKPILDIGSGSGHNLHQLKKLGYKKLDCVDVVDMSVFPEEKPKIYDGKKLPYKNGEFDVAMLITVLHHTPDPELIVKEASRVAKRLIIVEDTYNSSLQKYATFLMDSIGNMEFKGHPHTNKTDKEWLRLFKRNDLKLIEKRKERFLWFFESTTYCVEKS